MPTTPRRAPTFLNLFQIRFPVGAIASIGHRVSGVLLFISIPLLALLLERSLLSQASFTALGELASAPWRAALLVVLIWAAAHHILAGIRHLLMDVGIGSRLTTARRTALSTLVAAALIALMAAVVWLS
jgi:succinate dehydrogenase / fumarate reductase cytochrome b subunit